MAEGGGEQEARVGTSAVFVSYASQDAALANAIVEALERTGARCWVAPRDVTPGASYAAQIIHAIDAAQASVLILSKDAASSPHVLREVERSASKRHPIVSLRIDQAPLPADFEYFLNTSHWLDTSAGDLARALPKLVAAVQLALKVPAAKPAGEPTAHAPAPAASARLPNRKAIIVASLVGLGLVLFASDRLWLSSRRAAATQAPTSTTSTQLPAIAATTIPEKSVAVLPFLDMSEKKDQEYFSDGLSEELIDMLTKVPELRVPARTSSFYFKGKQATIAEIAKALGVAHVLEGSVRKSGNHLRITAQLVRADNGYHLWSETYDRQLNDIFKVQDEIAGAVVKALKVSLFGGSLPESAGTQNIEAYNLYLQAISMSRHAHDRTDYERVVEYLRRAVDADPQFANAWAELSGALLGKAQPHTSDVPDQQQLIQEARRAAQQALKLNPRLPDPHLAHAVILLTVDFDVRGAEAQIQQALELEPAALQLDPISADAMDMAALLPMYRGQLNKALELAQKSIAIDPVNPNPYYSLSRIYYFAGKYPEALAAIQKAFDLDPGPHQADVAAFILLAKGDPAAALTEIESNNWISSSSLVLAYDALGRKTEADAALANLEKHHAADNAYQIGLVYANRGQPDQAFEWFNRAYRQRDIGLLNLKLSPFAKNVRSDPRFNALLRKLDLLD
jgi:TolB-like protein/Flp pilus assembly protein TadD